MSNRLEQLLSLWQPQKEQLDWVLATVIETQGSSYRKAGAMMLINSLGQYHGMLSGGCLEADIMLQARKCWDTGNNHIVCYDMREEDDLSWQLGIGCGGMVKILLQPVTKELNWLELDQLKSNLAQRKQSIYCQQINQSKPQNHITLSTDFNGNDSITDKISNKSNQDQLIHKITPAPLIAIFGGGMDALPLVNMANNLGWKTLLIDERVNYARPSYFKQADQIIRTPFEQLGNADWLSSINAAVIMSHSIKLDAKALKLVQKSSTQFVGLLGPTHRTEKVLNEAGITYQSLSKPLSNPVGLDIGGELPESIALSILSEAHAVLETRTGKPLSNRLQHAG